MRSLFVVGLIMALSFTSVIVTGSDTESEPFMIYVDPLTGKYTKQKPEHKTTTQQTQTNSTVSNIPRPNPPVTPLSTGFFIAGGLILASHLLSRMLVGLRK